MKIHRATVATRVLAASLLTVLRARTEHEVLALLTPEQLKELQEHRHERGPRAHDGPLLP